MGSKNLLLLVRDPNERSSNVENKIKGEQDKVKRTKEVVLPTNEEGKENDNELFLRWSMRKQRDSKRKEKIVDSSVQVTISYSTRRTEKKLLTDAIKESKSSTTRKR